MSSETFQLLYEIKFKIPVSPLHRYNYCYSGSSLFKQVHNKQIATSLHATSFSNRKSMQFAIFKGLPLLAPGGASISRFHAARKLHRQVFKTFKISTFDKENKKFRKVHRFAYFWPLIVAFSVYLHASLLS